MSSTNKEIEILPRSFMAKIVFGWLFVLLAYFFINNNLVHQWQQPPLIYPEADNVFWLLHILNIPQSIMRSNTASLFFDVAMILSTTLFIIFPRKIIFAIATVVCFWLLHIMYSSSNGHHYHHVGYLIVPLPFIFRNQMRFSLSWQLIRYWLLFIYCSAGVYKLYYGGFFYQPNMVNILKAGSLDLSTIRGTTVLYLTDHPALAQILYQAATVLELSFIVGFFTRKLDVWLGVVFLLFHVANYLLLGISFWENAIILAVFLPWHKLYAITQKKNPPQVMQGI